MSAIKVGKPDVAIDAAAHLRRIRMGNALGAYEKQPGHHADGTADARRATGIVASRRNPVLAVMPNLPPG